MSGGDGGHPTATQVDEERSRTSAAFASHAHDLSMAAREVWLVLFGEQIGIPRIPIRPMLDLPAIEFLHGFGALDHESSIHHMLHIVGIPPPTDETTKQGAKIKTTEETTKKKDKMNKNNENVK